MRYRFRRRLVSSLAATAAIAVVSGVAGPAVEASAESPAAGAVSQLTQINLGSKSTFLPRNIIVEPSVNRIVLIDAVQGQLRTFTMTGRPVQTLHYAPPGDGGYLVAGPHHTLYEAARHQVLVRSVATLAVRSRIPLPSSVQQTRDTDIGLAADRIWVGVINQKADSISTPLANPGRWTASYTGAEASLTGGVVASSLSSPYTVSLSDPPVVGHVVGAYSHGVDIGTEIEGVDIAGAESVLDHAGGLWIGGYPQESGQFAPAVCGAIRVDQARPEVITGKVPDAICGGPALASPSGNYLGFRGLTSLEFAQTSSPFRSVIVSTANTTRTPGDPTAAAVTHDGHTLVFTSYNLYPVAEGRDLILHIDHIDLPSWK